MIKPIPVLITLSTTDLTRCGRELSLKAGAPIAVLCGTCCWLMNPPAASELIGHMRLVIVSIEVSVAFAKRRLALRCGVSVRWAALGPDLAVLGLSGCK